MCSLVPMARRGCLIGSILEHSVMSCPRRRAAFPTALTLATMRACFPSGRYFARLSAQTCCPPNHNGRVATSKSARKDGLGVVSEVSYTSCPPLRHLQGCCSRRGSVPATLACLVTSGSPISRSGPVSRSISWCWRCRGMWCSGRSAPGDGCLAADVADARRAATTLPGSAAARHVRSAERCRGEERLSG